MSLEDIEQDYDVSDTETVRALSQSLDLPVCVVDDPLPSEAVNEMEQSNLSTVETREDGKLNSVEDLTLMDFLQNLTEEQRSGIREGMFDPLTKQQLAGLCLRIVQFLSDKLMQINIPGLYELLGIQDADTSPLSQRSVTSVEDDKVNTKSRVRFAEVGVPKSRGSPKSYTSFHIPTPYPSSNCMEQEEKEHLKYNEIYLTKEMNNPGSRSYLPMGAMRQRSDVQSRISSHTPTEDSEHLGTKEHLCSASQDLSQASKSVPHFPSLNLVALHRGVSESSKLPWTETDEALLTNCTKEVISTILTLCKDQTSNAPCFSTVGKKISDVVNVFVGGVLSQLKDISLSRSPTPCEDMFECLQDTLERTYPVSLDCNTATSKGIASSHSLSTKSLQKLSSHEFQTKTEQGVSELLTRSFNIVEEGTTDKYLQSVSTSTTSTDIIQTMVKDLQELTQTTQSSDMVSGTSLLTTGQVSEKRIWSVARNVYHSLQSKIKDFLRKDVQRSDTTLGSIKIFTYGSSSSSPRASLGHLEVNQSSVTPGGKDACVDIPHELLPTIKSSEKVLATTELSGSMLEDIGTIRRRSADSQKTRKTSSSRSSISPTPTSKSRQSEWDFSLPGTPIPTELPAQSDCPIVRNTIIKDLFHTEDLLPVTFVDKVRQAAGVVVDMMVESVENTQEDEPDASHPDDLRSAVRNLRKIISTWTIHIFSHEFVDKMIAIQDSHSSPQVLTLAAAKSVSDSILSRMKWGKKRCSVSRKHSTQILQIFAEETLRGFLKQWSDEYEDINFDVSVQNDPNTSTCMVILQMITKATAKCSFESGTRMATSDIVEGVLDSERDTTSSTGEQVPVFNKKGSKKVSKDLCPQQSMEYQSQNSSPDVYFTESMTNYHGSLAPEGNYDIASYFPLEVKICKPSIFTRMCRTVRKGFSKLFKSSRKDK